MASTYNNIGSIFKEKGDLEKALEYYTKALQIFEDKSPNSLRVASTYGNIGLILQDKGDLEKALEY